MTILTVGATGKLAGLVVPALVGRGAVVRGLVRRPEQIQQRKTAAPRRSPLVTCQTPKASMLH